MFVTLISSGSHAINESKRLRLVEVIEGTTKLKSFVPCSERRDFVISVFCSERSKWELEQ